MKIKYKSNSANSDHSNSIINYHPNVITPNGSTKPAKPRYCGLHSYLCLFRAFTRQVLCSTPKEARAIVKAIEDKVRMTPEMVQNPYKLGTINYKHQVLYWLPKPSIAYKSTKFSEPILKKETVKFKILLGNIRHWQKEEVCENFLQELAMAQKLEGEG